MYKSNISKIKVIVKQEYMFIIDNLSESSTDYCVKNGNGSILHKDKLAKGDKSAQRQFCT